MRLRTLLIERYGNFDRTLLEFDPAPGRLNLLQAPNGAGKSVLRKAFHDLLFGIERESAMKFRFDYPEMHLRADAIAADGSAFSFGWQRKAGRIFPHAESEQAASRWLKELLEAITPRQVEQLFALDTERLRKGGLELASGDGTLGSALLSGTGELASARGLRRRLEERRAAIWEKSKSSRPLNSALARLAAAAKQRRDAVQAPRQLTALQTELEATRARKLVADEAATAATATLKRLNRIELTRAPLAALSEATTWLAAHLDAPDLPPGLPMSLDEQLTAAVQQASLAGTRLESARTVAMEATKRVSDAKRDEPAVGLEPELGRLAGALGDATKARKDSAGLRTEFAEERAQIAAALRDIGSSAAPEDASQLIPTVAAVAAARDQITQFTALTTTLQLARVRRQTARLPVEATRSDEAEAGMPAPDGLAALLAEIRQTREPGPHAVEVAQAVREAEAEAEACAARVPGWSGDAAALVALSPDTEQFYQRLATTLAAAEDKLTRAEEECQRQAGQRAKIEASLAMLRQQPLPDHASLHAARTARDRGWQLIFARAFGVGPDEPGEQAYCGDAPLPLVFERHLRAADALADARIIEIARVEQAAQLTSELANTSPAWEAAEAAVAQSSAAMTEAKRAWEVACAPLRLSADASQHEVRVLLTARELAITAQQTAKIARGTSEALIRQHAAWADSLAALLATPLVSLPSLLLRADATLQAAASAQSATAARETRRAQSEAEWQAASDAEQAAERALTAWRGAWGVTLQGLGRPAGELPPSTERVLVRLADLDLHSRGAAKLDKRLQDIAADEASFAATVTGLAARLGMAVEADAFTTADRLIARRETALSLESAAKEAEEARAAAIRRLHEATRQQQDTTDMLNVVLAACGADSVTGASSRVAAARERLRQQTARQAALHRMSEVGGGLPVDQLAAEVAELPPDQYDAQRQAAETALDQARAQEQAAAVALAELERRYDEESCATSAIEAAENEAQIAAEAARLLDEYLLLRVAAGMLGRALERVEQTAGPTGVQRIAAAFEAITAGAWTIRASETARGETLLMAVEQGLSEPAKHIGQLSEGTRDQLYLALRLVAIEDHVAAAQPLPFIADDILQTFDDNRARAAMQALVGLSHHVQVIVLTHHPHLLALAAGLPVHVQKL